MFELVGLFLWNKRGHNVCKFIVCVLVRARKPERPTDSGGRCVCVRACITVNIPAALFLSSIFSYTQRDLTLNQTVWHWNMISLDLFTNRQMHCGHNKLVHSHKLHKCIFTMYLCTHRSSQTEWKAFYVCFSILFYMTNHLLIMLHCKREKGNGRKAVLVFSWGAPVAFRLFSLLSCHLVFVRWWSQRQLVLTKQVVTWKLPSYWDILY